MPIFAANAEAKMKKCVDDFLVTENTSLNASTHLIRLRCPRPLPVILPGQFVNAEIKNCRGVFLRRPFSVFEADYPGNSLSLIVKIAGEGSYHLTLTGVGETVSLVYPLGRPFTMPGKGDRILMVGGGTGMAPLLFLAKESGIAANQVTIILGARTIDDHFDVDSFKSYGNIHFTTEDGSLGTRGLVTSHPMVSVGLERFEKIYTCGPLPMMKAVATLAGKGKVWCEASLENLMACGFGACLCCIEPTTGGNSLVCTDGPVFNTNDLTWLI